jgi:hypothetical protein
MAKRDEVRQKSADFLRGIVEKAKQKEDPAVPDFGEKDTQKIEKITKSIRENKPVEFKPRLRK